MPHELPDDDLIMSNPRDSVVDHGDFKIDSSNPGKSGNSVVASGSVQGRTPSLGGIMSASVRLMYR